MKFRKKMSRKSSNKNSEGSRHAPEEQRRPTSTPWRLAPVVACYHPIHGFRGLDGTFKGSRTGAFRDKPMTISCGQCSGCRLEKSRQKAVQGLHELKTTPDRRSCYLTLTFDNEHLPEDLSLDKAHWQNFAKKVRNRIGKFRYLQCGEYGEPTEDNDYIARPHYHAICYGIDFLKTQNSIRKPKTATASTPPPSSTSSGGRATQSSAKSHTSPSHMWPATS